MARTKHTETSPLLTQPPENDTPPPPPSDVDSDADEVTQIVTFSPLRITFIILAGNLAFFLSAIDHTILATLAGPISADLASLSLLPYMGAAYAIVLSPSVALTGRLTDIYGRGPALAVAMAIFGLGNFLCGVTTHPWVFLLGRAFTGIGTGPACIVPMMLNSDLVPPSRRGLVNSLMSIAWGSGCALGGFFGGFIHDAFNWRIAFLVQVPPCIVVTALIAVLVRIPPKTSRSGRSRLSRIDWVGALLVVSGLLLFQAPLNAGGIIIPWSHPLVGTSVATSIIVLAGAVVWELRTRYPMIPVRMLSNRTVCAASLGSLGAVCQSLIVTFYIPLFFQVFGMSATEAGSRLLVTAVGCAVGGFVGGWAINKIGYTLVGVIFSSLVVVGIAIMSTADDSTPTKKSLTWLAVYLIGIGSGPLSNVTFLGGLTAINDQAQVAAVTTVVQVFRELGCALGVVLPAAIFENVLHDRLWARFGNEPGAGKIIDDILDEVLAGTLPDGWWENGVREAFVDSFQWVWRGTLVVCVGCVFAMACMRNYRLREDFERDDERD